MLVLTWWQRQNLIAKTRARADTDPALSEEQRVELRRLAHNLECVQKFVTERNQHDPHPTLQ